MNSQSGGEAAYILDIKGDVDFYTSLQLKQDSMQAVERGIKHVVVNLSKVGYMDCAGLGVLISSLKQLHGADGTLTLVGLEPRVQRLFEATGTAKIFDIYSTEEAATAEDAFNAKIVEGELVCLMQ